MQMTETRSLAWTILDWDRELLVTNEWQEVEKAIHALPQLAKTTNTIVNLVSPPGDTLSFGIALPNTQDNPNLEQPLACVNFMSRSRNPPYLTVIGDERLNYDSGGVVVFRYEEGTWTEVLRRNCVPRDVLVRIVHHFFTTGLLPTWIAWEEV